MNTIQLHLVFVLITSICKWHHVWHTLRTYIHFTNHAKCSIVNFNFVCIFLFKIHFLNLIKIFSIEWQKSYANITCYWHHADNTDSFPIQSNRFTCHRNGDDILWKIIIVCLSLNKMDLVHLSSRFKKLLEMINS